jgi:hypothetical protein
MFIIIIIINWVFTEYKNYIFIKICGTKKIHGPNSRGTSRTQLPSTKIFFKGQICWKSGFFLKSLHRILSENTVQQPKNKIGLTMRA